MTDVKWQIPYAGTVYEFDDARLTAAEARLQKRLTDGLTPTAAEAQRLELDPDAWLAALAIARRRTGVDAGEVVDVDLDEVDLMQVMELTRQAVTEQPKPKRGRKSKIEDVPAEPDPQPDAA